MTTIIPYQPTTQAPFQFQPVLDGATYNAAVVWGLFGKRPYLSITALDGTQIVYEALVGSPSGINIQSLSWSEGTATLTCDVPHGFRIGTNVMLAVSGVTPDGYNGAFTMLATSPTALSYSANGPLDTATQLGAVSYDINLVAGYGFASRLVFRAQAQQFEVSP